MAEQDVINAHELVEREVTDARAGVDQHVIVEQKRSGLAASGDGTGAAEDANDHLVDIEGPVTREMRMGSRALRQCNGSTAMVPRTVLRRKGRRRDSLVCPMPRTTQIKPA